MKRLLFSMATAAVLLAGGNSAMAQTSGRWNPYIDIEGRAGDREERSQSRTFIPIFQDDCSMLFGDIRMMYIEGGAWEGNFGLGHRRILSSQRVLGIYGFYDVRDTTSDNTFHQGSVGAELLDINWGIRSNVYLPDTASQNARGGNAFLQGNQILVQGNQERAYYGVDVEAEHILWRDDCTTDIEIWAAGGYFHFDNSATNFQHISGPRARVEARLYDLPVLGNDSRIVASGQYEYDDVRGSVNQGFLSVRIPLGCGGKCRPKMSLLDRRMVTPIMRDVDIVTNVAQGGDIFQGVNAKTGTILDDVVTLTALDDIRGDVNGGPDGRTFILDGVDGSEDIMDSIELNDGQILIGGGGSMNVVGFMSGLEAVFTADGDPFAINQMDGGDRVIDLGRDNGIYGLTLDGGRDSIFGFEPGSFEIAGNTLTGATDDLIQIIGGDTVVGCIINNTLGPMDGFPNDGEDEGIHVRAYGGADFDLDISGNSFLMVDSDALKVDVSGGTVNIDFWDNNVTAPDSSGFEIDLSDDGSLTANIWNNTFDGVNSDAIEVDADDSSFLDLTVSNNLFLGSGTTSDGVEIDLNDDAELILVVENNIFDDVQDDAVEIDAEDSTILDVLIAGNTFLGRGNTGDGIDIEVNDIADLTLLVQDNIFDDIDDSAVEIDADDNTILDALIAGNTFLGRGNTVDGIDIELDDDAELNILVENNIFDDILEDGIFADISDDALLNMDVYDNQFIGRGNTEDGIDIEMDDDSTVNFIVGHNIFDNIHVFDGEGSSRAFEVDAEDDSELYLEFYGNKILGRSNTNDGVDIDIDDASSLVAIIEQNLFKNLTEDAIHIDGNYEDAELIVDILDNKFRNVAEGNIQVHADWYSKLDAIINNNDIKGGVEGIDVRAGYEGDNFLTIGGNKMTKITGIGISVQADDELFLDDAGLNNKVKVDGGVVSDIDDDGDVIGTIRINGTDITVP